MNRYRDLHKHYGMLDLEALSNVIGGAWGTPSFGETPGDLKYTFSPGMPCRLLNGSTGVIQSYARIRIDDENWFGAGYTVRLDGSGENVTVFSDGVWVDDNLLGFPLRTT